MNAVAGNRFATACKTALLACSSDTGAARMLAKQNNQQKITNKTYLGVDVFILIPFVCRPSGGRPVGQTRHDVDETLTCTMST
jgi:hypothetical protein